MIDENTLKLIKQAQSGDKEAVGRLIETNIGLIWSIVRRFTNRGYDAEDLFQIGTIGMIKCIQKFDLNYDVKFSTYAVPMIMGEIRRFLRDDGMIKVSRPLKEIAVKAKYTQDMLMKKKGREPSVNEIAAELNISADELVAALDADKEVESLYATVYQGDGNPVYLIDKIETDNDGSDKIIDSLFLHQLIEQLDEREQQIIKLRYFQEKTQTEVAERLGVSQVQISRLEKKLLLKLREEIKKSNSNKM